MRCTEPSSLRSLARGAAAQPLPSLPLSRTHAHSPGRAAHTDVSGRRRANTQLVLICVRVASVGRGGPARSWLRRLGLVGWRAGAAAEGEGRITVAKGAAGIAWPGLRGARAATHWRKRQSFCGKVEWHVTSLKLKPGDGPSLISVPKSRKQSLLLKKKKKIISRRKSFDCRYIFSLQIRLVGRPRSYRRALR